MPNAPYGYEYYGLMGGIVANLFLWFSYFEVSLVGMGYTHPQTVKRDSYFGNVRRK